MATIYDVARLAGVSRSTVSRVLNRKNEVDPKTAVHVMQAIQKLNYHPNASARALVRQKSDMIGVMLSDVTNPFYQKMVKGIESVTAAHNIGVLYYNTYENLNKHKTVISNVIDSGKVDGLIIIGSNKDDEEVIWEFVKRGVPMVLIERCLPSSGVSCITSNNIQGGELAIEHFVRLGHSKIAFITGGLRLRTALERLEGFKQGMQKYHLPIHEEYIVQGNFEHDTGYASMKQLLKLKNRPTGVFVSNDMMALGAILATHDLGLSVPEDVAVIGYDDIFFASLTYPQLTTVRQPMFEMGKIGAQELLNRISRGDKNEPVIRKFPVKLMFRRSCGLFSPTRL